ncbi:MAG: hypothetical protein NTU89_01610 [Candidatus Dependentiae bacterium]|nr:hypothetical protein [Candidatus Dependentiae bacterium]
MKIIKLILVGLCVVLPGVIQAEPIVLDPVDTEFVLPDQFLDQKEVEPTVEHLSDLSSLEQQEYVLMDQIECVVCGPERNTPIVNTDVSWKRALDGKFVDLPKQIQQDIVAQQVVSEKMPMEASAAEKYVEGLKKQNNLTDLDLADMFAEVGRTAAEGLAQLHDQYVQEFFMHYKFKSQLVATDDEINDYFNEYPEFINGWSDIQFIKVPYAKSSREQVKEKVNKFVATGESADDSISWGSVNRLADDEIAPDKLFILEMTDGQIVVEEEDGAFELYKLVGKESASIKSLEDRRSAIIDSLNRKKLEKMLSDYNKSVSEFVDVIFLNQESA